MEYAPTKSHQKEEVDDIYEEIQIILDNSKSLYKILMGDQCESRNKAEQLAEIVKLWIW